jgi:hypothetical protein
MHRYGSLFLTTCIRYTFKQVEYKLYAAWGYDTIDKIEYQDISIK